MAFSTRASSACIHFLLTIVGLEPRPVATSGGRSFGLNDVHRPRDLVLRGGVVRAEGACANGTVEVAPERRVALLDPPDRAADRAGGVHAGALGGGAGGPVAPPQPHGPGQPAGDQLALLPGPRRPAARPREPRRAGRRAGAPGSPCPCCP